MTSRLDVFPVRTSSSTRPVTASFPRISFTTECQMNRIFEFFSAFCRMMGDARSSSRR